MYALGTPNLQRYRRPGDAHTLPNKPYGISSKTMISPQIRNRILYFHYAFGFTFPMTRIHVRLLGPCFKTGQADHACIRLQSTEQCQINDSYRQSASHNMLRQAVHTSYAHNSYKPLTASKRLFMSRMTAVVVGKPRLETTRLRSYPAPKLPISVTCNPMTRINAAHRQQVKRQTLINSRKSDIKIHPLSPTH